LLDKKPVLICIDIQMGFQFEEHWGGNRNNKNAEEVCGKLINKWRQEGLEIVHVRHASLEPNSLLREDAAGFEFHPLAMPQGDELIITKNVNSAFIGTDLQEVLEEKGHQTLIICGLTTDHCVSTTTRMAGNFGYETYLVEDATATFDKLGADGTKFDAQLIHDTALASLNGEFCSVIKSSQIL